MVNRSTITPGMPDYPIQLEMSYYDRLTPELRKVIRDAPFDVSVADILNNSAVMREIERRGDQAPKWLEEQLLLTYRRKISA